MRHIALIVLLASGCWRPLCQPDEPPTYHEETHLAFRQPNRDPSFPKFQTVRLEDDGTYYEIDSRSMPHPHQNVWGRRKRVVVETRYMGFSTPQTIEKVLEDVEDIKGEFRIHGISAPYFRKDRRTFIDEKPLECISEEVCTILDEAINNGKKFDLLMRFGATFDAPLILTSVEPPTCQSTMDCSIREECCHVENTNVCVEDMTCPTENRVTHGVVGEIK